MSGDYEKFHFIRAIKITIKFGLDFCCGMPWEVSTVLLEARNCHFFEEDSSLEKVVGH